MEKAKFTFSDGSGADEFFVLEETKINGSAYILVVDSEEDDAECLILREVEESKDAEKTYEIVEEIPGQDCRIRTTGSFQSI